MKIIIFYCSLHADDVCKLLTLFILIIREMKSDQTMWILQMRQIWDIIFMFAWELKEQYFFFQFLEMCLFLYSF